ncbi:MAG: tetratricopeptide repeat protein [Candidatus Kapaibacteriota bacterium]
MKTRLFSIARYKLSISVLIIFLVAVEMNAKPMYLQDSVLRRIKWEDGYKEAVIGEAYNYGLKNLIDKAKAVTWWKESAKKKHPLGIYNLGFAYSVGYGYNLERDSVKAEKYYIQAFPGVKSLAERGDLVAQSDLGDMYFGAQGVPQNLPEAVKWYRKAAEQGYAPALYGLGLAYLYGQKVECARTFV